MPQTGHATSPGANSGFSGSIGEASSAIGIGIGRGAEVEGPAAGGLPDLFAR